ncbi:YibE/F family protein [Leuconostoc mesenteroides]|uniref:YibE/F family protein n=1 Tax=Leuconostoc mesenteroides TaxID=1245 RepID=UPI002360ED16|nr:YibE/F family protein [Leuconostoc mesenteroides]
MNAIGLLIIILFILMVFVGGVQGMKAFVGLVLNFIVIFILMILINWQFNAYIVTALMSVIILALAIYLGAENQFVTNTAFKTSLIVVSILMVVAILVQHLGQFQGFATENSEELEGLSSNVNLPFTKVAVIVMVISILGAVAEAAMAIVADLNEVIERTPNLSKKSLYAHAHIIGGQILGTAINTLFFGVLGANLPLLIWFIRLRYSIAMFFNAKLLMMEVVTMLLGMLGILMSIWLASRLVVHGYVKIQSKNMRKGE